MFIGAPAIAIVAALALAVELENKALGTFYTEFNLDFSY
jgi:methylthioribose-1-phosphate isomerase